MEGILLANEQVVAIPAAANSTTLENTAVADHPRANENNAKGAGKTLASELISMNAKIMVSEMTK